ncbi:unnamed protein product [Zymoseptoria tritici ST99CH_3D1]|nr:unnamed protein product [Zymoseptoria tritici ST99CH_3D1]
MSDRSSLSPSSDANVGGGARGEGEDGGKTGTEMGEDMDVDMDINTPDDTPVAYSKTRDVASLRAVTDEEGASTLIKLDFTTCTLRDGPLNPTSLLSSPPDAIRSTLTTREHSPTIQISEFNTAADMKRQLSELPDDDRHTKRQMLNASLRLSASKGILSSLWLTAIAKGGSDEEGLRTSCRRVDDTSAYPIDSRTCILYTNEAGHIVACAYINKRKTCRLYLAEETAIDVGNIKQHLSREMENDEDVEVVEFIPVITTFPHYAVVIAATCMCIHRPVPDDIVAFSPIWSHAITTLASGTADGDNDPGAALATVADVLLSTAHVISTISQTNSSKKGGRVTKTAEEIRYYNKLSKLICEALDAKAALAEALLADVALIAYLASFALDRSGGAENQFDGDVQEEIVSFEASLAA